MFIADCPRGHKGAFIIISDYNICHCGLRVPIIADIIQLDMEEVEEVQQTDADNTPDINRLIEPVYIAEVLQRLKDFDPEFPRNLPKEISKFFDNLK